FINRDIGNGIFGRFKARSSLRPIKKILFPITRFFSKQREHMTKSIKKILPNKNGDFLAAIILGNNDQLDAENQMILSRSGISHITAVSGLHVFILCHSFLICASFLKIPPRPTALFMTIFLLFFASITGFSSSIARAAIMIIILQFATLVGEKSDALNALSVSMILILLQNPYNVLNLGFILSFSTTLSIILFTKPLEKLLTQNFIASRNISESYCKIIKSISAALSVYILLAPIIVLYFGYFPFLAIITNIIVAPILPIIVILSFAIGIFSMSTILSPIAVFLGFFANIALSILIGVASIISNSSLAVVSFENTVFYAFIVSIFSFIICLLCFIHIKYRASLLIFTVCSLFCFILYSIDYSNGKSEIIALNNTNCVLIKQPDSFFIIGSPNSSYESAKLTAYLKNHYITDISGFIFETMDNTTLNAIKEISKISTVQNLINIQQAAENNIGHLQIDDSIFLTISKSSLATLSFNTHNIIKLFNDTTPLDSHIYDGILTEKNQLYTKSSQINPKIYKFVTVIPLS
ncbi:MAG: ComEC/Rec2 family competence protein, partial [Oscillospiraceae bacterium]